MAGKILEPIIISFFLAALTYVVLALIFGQPGFAGLIAGGVFFWQAEKRYFASIPDDVDEETPEKISSE